MDGVPVVVPMQGPGVTIQTQPFYGYPSAGQTTIGGPVHFQAVGNQPQLVVVPSPGGNIPPQYTERSQQVPLEEPILTVSCFNQIHNVHYHDHHHIHRVIIIILLMRIIIIEKFSR